MIQLDTSSSNSIFLPAQRLVFDGGHAEADFAVITHAHSDHAPRGKRVPVVCTPLTAELLRIRGFSGDTLPLDFLKPLELPHATLTFYPAGHIPGSAMVFIESDQGSLLYTGDFKSPPSPVTEGFLHPDHAGIIITEATFSLPIYRWKPHKVLFEQVRQFAVTTLEEGKTPVFLAYSLGKTQELLHALAPLELTTHVHTAAFALSKAIEAAGFNLGRFARLEKNGFGKHPVIVPGANSIPPAARIKTAYVSGWAAHEAGRQQQAIDERIALSDHADFFEVLDFCTRLSPKMVYVTHSPYPEIVCESLRTRGIAAEPLGIRREQGAE